jgi:3-phenylpropionate/cinnamic acid dioxygenase small subunit
MSLSIEDKLAIHELLARWAYAYDERETAMLADCFTENANFSMRIAGGDLVGPFAGREAIMELMTGSLDEQTDVRRHVVSNIFFEAEGDQPRVISTLTLMATENGEIQLLSAGVYRDTVVNEAGVWRLVNRHLDLDKAY